MKRKIFLSWGLFQLIILFVATWFMINGKQGISGLLYEIFVYQLIIFIVLLFVALIRKWTFVKNR